MSIVTIRGQLGSGAPEIGKLVADKLHTDYVDREIIAQVAERLHWPEQEIVEKEMPPGTLLRRIAEAMGRGYALGTGSEGAYLPTWEIPLDDNRYIIGLESVIKELASSQSIVIRGRGSQFILRDHPGALHVLVVAPLEIRVKRVMESLKLEEESAKKEIERFDSSRREFTKRYFQAELEDPLYYDLVINTERVNFEDAASIIINAVHFKDKPEMGEQGSAPGSK
jgi:cytidylate kinase